MAIRNRDSFFLIAGVAILTIVVVGFAPTLYLRPIFRSTELPVHLMAHGISMTLWYVLFVVQAYLIRKRAIPYHRILGVAGVIVAVFILITGFLTLDGLATRNISRFGSPTEGVKFIVIQNSLNFVVFVSLIIVGVVFRQFPDIHKRAMLLASLTNISPVFSPTRVLGQTLYSYIPESIDLGLLVKLLFLAFLFVFDYKSKGKVLPITLVGTAATLFAFLFTEGISDTAVGTSFVENLASWI